jgi:hypothetical protein
VYGDDVMTVQPVRKWHSVSENGQMNIMMMTALACLALQGQM